MTLPSGLETERGYANGLTPILVGNHSSGVIDDSGEPNVDLTWPSSVKTYHQMRNDAKIGEVLRALTLPIRAARRHLDPNGAPPEVVQHVATDLTVRVLGGQAPQPARSRGRFSLDEHMRMALLELVYGHMPFEQVYRISQDPAGLRAHLAKLAPRHPLTIDTIDVARDGGLVSLTQFGQGGIRQQRPTPITVDRLVWYAHDREGGNWQGRSLLREAYGPWRRKDRALRTWLTHLDRNGGGQPVYHGAPNETQAQLAAGAALAQRSRVGETAGVGVPNGASITWEGVRGSLPDHEAFVRYCDEEIASNVLAEFLKLGSSTSGSRSLGETFVDFFTLALQAIADDVVRTFNEHVIEDLVDLNFGEDVPAPRLVLEDVGADHTLTAESLAGLLAAGALTADPELEQHVRDVWRLPQRDPDAPPVPASPAPAARAPRKPVRAAAAAGDPAQDDVPPQEQYADFEQIDADWQAELAAVVAAYLLIREDQAAELVEQVAAGITSPAELQLATGAAAGAILAALLRMWTLAAARAAAETAAQGQTVTATEPDVDLLRGHADVVAELLASSLKASAAREALRLTATEDPAAGVEEHLNSLTDAQPTDLLGEALTSAQNAARGAVLGQVTGGAYYAAERLDKATCGPCREVDGTRYDNVLDVLAAYPLGGYVDCEGRGRCRGLAVWWAGAQDMP